MEENQHQDNTPKKVDPSALLVVGEKETEETEAKSSGPNGRHSKIKKWLNRHNEPSPHLIINILLMMATFLLFWKAVSQSDSAQTAANAAREAVAEYRQANKTSDSNYQLAKRAYESSEKDNQNRFIRDSIFFSIQTEPYIECVINTVDPIKTGEQFKFTYSYLNYGSYPAKTIAEKMEFVITDDSAVTLKKILKGSKNKSGGNYIIKEAPEKKGFSSDHPMPKAVSDYFSSNKTYIYIGVHLEYENLVTKRIKYYDCVIRIESKRMNGVDYLLNENDTVERFISNK